jgi:hypothetical protein
LMRLTMTRPFSTATPDNAVKPTPAEIEKGIPREAPIGRPRTRRQGSGT